MVKIAIAGGSGDVGQEILDTLLATKKHEILLLSRKNASVEEMAPAVTWVQTNYKDPQKLAEILQGVHTVLSFIVVHSDTGNMAQKHLIDAAVQAGVKRFAPSEWASSSFEHMSWYAGKTEIRKYLKRLNKDKKALEYSLFQPGLFMNYFTNPYKTAKHVTPIETPIDFNNRRALVVEGGDNDRITLTTVRDLANVVARAIDYDGEWPVVGGIKGAELTVGQLISLGERIRGGQFAVERLKADDLASGELKSSWRPKAGPPAFPREQFDAISAMLMSDYKFTKAEDFLAEAWSDAAEPPASAKNFQKKVGDRLGRVEAMIEQLTTNAKHGSDL
ncbi:nmrA-like family domain-containing protein [Hirsutella rhossiliensis]|uniref:NmrA-like family domain-containing protein n=1 Tax=Hirsutella rhossiliensis TaxID=111463 RepID=A0A9P8MMM3_9HYPO|nr:nmrA-like family domain-containing protein [Hirsutella rhossiliensis]KAH0958148.1 nmrA-like family domain-containing protein [Hirsutella rhossiliensis]